MEKRVILAFVLSFAVLYAFRALYSPPQPATPAATTVPEIPPVAPVEVQPPATPEASTKEQPPAEAPATEVKTEKAEDVSFETPLYIATFSNVGRF
jgi:YidC/Oxa1 family membrane protein insertase